MSKFFTAIDLGNGNFKVAVAEKKGEASFSIVSAFSCPSSGFRKGMLIDFDDAYDVLKDIVDDIKKISKKFLENVLVSVQSEHIKTRISKGAVAISNPSKEVKTEDIEKVRQLSLAFKATPSSFILDDVVKEYVVDDVRDIIDPLGMQGSRLEVETLIIEGASAHFYPIFKLLSALGINEWISVFSPLASAEAVLSKKQKNLGVLLVDLGFGNTNLALFEEGKLIYAKTLPLGSSYITSDIAIGFKIPVEVAEKIKVNLRNFFAPGYKRDSIKLADVEEGMEGEISKKFLNEIVTMRVMEIVDLVEMEIKSLGKHIDLPGGVVITGGGAKLYKVEDIFKERIKLPVQVGYPNLSKIEVLNPSLREMLEEPEFAVTVGLLLKSLEKEKREKTINTIKSFKDFLKSLLP